jgi:hypothetical protein
MEYKEAIKKVQTKKTKENFLVVEVAYNVKFVLPYKEGMVLMASMAVAEELDEPYNKQHRIKEIDRNNFKTYVMSNDEYERIKVAAMLGVTPAQVLEAQETQ